MTKSEYQKIENYMLECMSDRAHDCEHVYRVLYVALDIADHEPEVDMDVLITAALLHDIGRKEQFENPKLCHAQVGAEKARKYLLESGYDAEFAGKVESCIRTHRYRSSNLPQTIEEKILFDADKIEATGTLGIARTLLYNGKEGEPLYSLNEDGLVSDGSGDVEASFFHFIGNSDFRKQMFAEHKLDKCVLGYDNKTKEVLEDIKTFDTSLVFK